MGLCISLGVMVHFGGRLDGQNMGGTRGALGKYGAGCPGGTIASVAITGARKGAVAGDPPLEPCKRARINSESCCEL